MINCASPDYLQRYGTPEHPEQLAGHWGVGYAQPTLAGADTWVWQRGDQHMEKILRSRVTVNNAENYIGCCLAGLGMIQIPRFDVQHYLDNGSLCEVLPQARPPAMGIALLYPHRRQRSARLTAFAEWFSHLIKPFCEN